MGSACLDREMSDDATTVYVRGVLRVVKHRRRGSRGRFGGFVEYLVVGSVENDRVSAGRVGVLPLRGHGRRE
jgi:hypothetical protein